MVLIEGGWQLLALGQALLLAAPPISSATAVATAVVPCCHLAS